MAVCGEGGSRGKEGLGGGTGQAVVEESPQRLEDLGGDGQGKGL